ncbi:hypothetical protein HW115_01725 [Verrucomicrobiaceae bacterium N1E253]|uniref:Terminase small subunit n=1 Tax=Oceaniferula marina TaxID=2748318 RepID=A0A851G9N2_9BACT|nr:terminase small subunit [Oceaniferula marina]NWK54313.1 hypothetical protein [Oceaniferula marina]
MAQKLNDQQRNALRYVATGMTLTEAGRKAGYSVSNAPQMVSKLMRRADAQEYLGTLRDKADTPFILDITARKEHLSKIATSQLATPTEQMAAIHLLNKMDGLYVQKVEADINHGGVMLVPVVNCLEDWEKAAVGAQAQLMKETIELD